MKKIQNYIFLAIKGVVYIYLPAIVLLSIFYCFVLGRGFALSWNLLFFYPLIIAISIVSNYRKKTMEIGIEDFTQMEVYIEKASWEIVDKSEDGLLVKPTFDFPFRMIIEDTVSLKYIEKGVFLEGPRYYVDNMGKNLKGQSTLWTERFTKIGVGIIIVLLVLIPISDDLGVRWEINKYRHNKFVENVEVIDFESVEVLGNSIMNTNNYGLAVENEKYIFYIKDHFSLIRVDKDFNNEKVLIQRSGGNGLASLNIVGDWIYYTAGQELNRMSIDGSKNEIIYKSSYLQDVNMKNNWIYFINFLDEFNLYRMDLNGRDLEKFLDVYASDISIYDGRIIFSHIKDDKYYVESINLDGSHRRLEFEDKADNLIKLGEYYYYIGENYGLYRRDIDENIEQDLLVDGQVSSYALVNDKIFYSLFSEEEGYPGNGVYHVELDGSSNTSIMEMQRIEGFAVVGDWLLFNSENAQYESSLNKMNLITGEIEVVE
ncbi:MAG: DUF5050 domain-containing protein [Gudongella sp.]|nr:DUF5050 domain-containing protein [Gudongella sp.]